MSLNSSKRNSISKVWAKNFRSIEKIELDLADLTVLVGPNASGKSNLLDIFGFLSDAVRLGLETAITMRGGIDSIGRRSSSGKILGPEIGFQYEFERGNMEYSFALTRLARGEYRVRKELAKVNARDSEFTAFACELTNGRLTQPKLNKIFERKDSKDSEAADRSTNYRTMIKGLVEELENNDLNLISVEPSQLVAMLSFFIMAYHKDGFFDSPSNLLRKYIGESKEYLSNLGVYHIFPNSLREPQRVAESYPLAGRGENLASTIRDMLQKKGALLSDLRDAMAFAVPGVRDVRVTSAGSFFVIELYHETGVAEDRGSWFDLSHESDGTIRLLAMLTVLFQDPAPSLICLEEPELAIHPGAMAVLSDTMAEASLRSQVVVATHSPDLINRIPVESIRAVSAERGSTKVGSIADQQIKSIRDKLFMPGEIHSMEGLQPSEEAT